MTRKDCARAAAVGALAMAVDVLILIGVATIAALVSHAQGGAGDRATASALGEWSARIAGPYVLGLLIWTFSRTRPDRNPCMFGLWVWVSHFAMYAAVLRLEGLLTPLVMMTMALKLVGALIGASLAMTSLIRSRDD